MLGALNGPWLVPFLPSPCHLWPRPGPAHVRCKSHVHFFSFFLFLLLLFFFVSVSQVVKVSRRKAKSPKLEGTSTAAGWGGGEKKGECRFAQGSVMPPCVFSFDGRFAHTFFTFSVEASAFSVFKTIASSYHQGDVIPVMVSSLTSRTKVMPMPWKSLVPCLQKKRKKRYRRNIGQLLFGDQLEESPYEVAVLKNATCVPLCTVTMTTKEQKHLSKLIQGRYRGHLYVDDLPGLVDVAFTKGGRRVTTGYTLGYLQSLSGAGRTVINNHLIFTISYHPVESPFNLEGRTYRIVQFQITPTSVRYDNAICDSTDLLNRSPQLLSDGQISFSYSVHWVESPLTWSTRWDVFMKMTTRESKVHWFSIVNFFIITLLQTLVLWYVLIRALRKDFLYYNELGAEEQDETGWKFVHGDVFRRPRGVGLLSICVGTGTQLAMMLGATLCVACMGFFSPQSRGLLASTLLFLFVLFSFFNGMVTAMLIKYMKMRSWKLIITTSLFYPAQMFIGYFVLNFIHLGNHAASSASLYSLFILLLLWQGVSTPLLLLGAAVGFRLNITTPVKVSSIPRTIPRAPWYFDSVLTIILPGFVPFSASHVEVTYIFGSVWHGAVYYMFGFLLAVYVLVMVVAAQTAVLSTYIQLNRQNYHWWWRSFLTSASYGVWIFFYSIFYYFTYSTLKGFVSAVLFFGYMGMVAYTLCLLSGAVGFLASFAFVRVIYSNVKME
ncbi:endosomal integral membrane protein, putative [Trypanosoma cruzi marinkellei]|uniref:Transmembrane 9 superfamily member n=1 Tax=Trypanosoma cruzi marinkellei TaxID=85056 RepID=K2MRS2_TRYCR|nr:endosomal integral membrane protein, putative [Trypanosoma cruzi marinkellei]